MVAAIERGYPQREIADAAYRYQMAVDRKEKIIVGVNDYVTEEKPIEILQIDESVGAAAGGTPAPTARGALEEEVQPAARRAAATPPRARKT